MNAPDGVIYWTGSIQWSRGISLSILSVIVTNAAADVVLRIHRCSTSESVDLIRIGNIVRGVVPIDSNSRGSYMHDGRVPAALRRSSRVSAALPILVTSLAGTGFSEVCKTLVVNAHGCAVLSPVKFDPGIPLRFKTEDGREATAQVVSCQSLEAENGIWKLGAKLERAQNFWGLADCPADWALPTGALSAKLQQITSRSTALAPKSGDAVALPPEAILDLLVRRLETPIRRMIAEAVIPLQAEITAIKEVHAKREANPSRFEVSLSQIPPELEQQLKLRLSKELEPKVVEASRQQYLQLLEHAGSAIERRTTEGYQDFLRRLGEELKNVEQRAQQISTRVSADTREQLSRGLADYHRQLLEGGNKLKRLTEELLDFARHNLNEEHNACQQSLEQARTSVAVESSRLQKEVEDLDRRIARLGESVHSLESGLDKRLGQMSGNVVKDTRTQLEGMANEALNQLREHGAHMLTDQMDQTSEKITFALNSIIASASESLKYQTEKSLQAFENSIDEMAMLSVEGWRLKLAANLSTLAKSLGDQGDCHEGE